MALLDEIEHFRNESLAALDASHDFYAHTASAWRMVQRLVRPGRSVSLRNLATDNAIENDEIPEIAQHYTSVYLTSATFQQFVSLFEDFAFDFLRAWLVAYPASLSGKKKLDFQVVLDSANRDEIIEAVVQEELAGLRYQRADAWFKYLKNIVKLRRPTQAPIERLAEIKASRDVLVHNKGIANSVYIDRSTGRARFKAGEALEIPEQYHRASWQLVKQVVADIADAAVKKLGK